MPIETDPPLAAPRELRREVPWRAPETADPAQELSRALQRYRGGESRRIVFRDLVLDSMRAVDPNCSLSRDKLAVLDIGCGHGFDHQVELQALIAAESGSFIGIEPDPDIAPPRYFTSFHRCLLEDAPLDEDSIDVAYSTFVLEHVVDPPRFWGQIHRALRPGGVFWGFTVDARHPFCLASMLLGKLRLKETYLSLLHGRRGETRYESYRTYYRANTPRRVRRQTGAFRRVDFLSMHREGQLNYYFPRALQPAARVVERWSMRLNLPGSILVMRLQK